MATLPSLSHGPWAPDPSQGKAAVDEGLLLPLLLKSPLETASWAGEAAQQVGARQALAEAPVLFPAALWSGWQPPASPASGL